MNQVQRKDNIVLLRLIASCYENSSAPKYGNESIMVTGSSRGPGNEVNFVMQKFARAVLGNNNIDCCARV